MSNALRSSVVLEHLDLLISHLEKSIDDSTSREQWKNLAHGVLFYWLDKMFAEATGRVQTLETAVEVMKTREFVLKQQNARLLMKVKELEARLRQT